MKRVDQVLVSKLIGGAASIAIRLAALVQARGGVSRAWLPGRGPAAEELEKNNVPCRFYELENMMRNPFLHGVACLKIAKSLAAQPRLIHIHTPLVYRFFCPALKFSKAKAIVHVHLEESEESLRWEFKTPPDMAITCAEYLAESIRRIGDKAGWRFPVVAVPNAVDLERYQPGDKAAAKIALGAPASQPMILMMANLAPHKGQETAIRATAVLNSNKLPVVCWLAGEDRQEGNAYLKKLQALARELGIGDSVKFLGFRKDGPELMRAADVVLLPSTREGMPICLLESQAVRTPVIGAPHPGILEIIEDGVNGFIRPQDDYAGYADRIRDLLENNELCGRICTRARERVIQRHSWQVFENRIIEAYKLAGFQAS